MSCKFAVSHAHFLSKIWRQSISSPCYLLTSKPSPTCSLFNATTLARGISQVHASVKQIKSRGDFLQVWEMLGWNNVTADIMELILHLPFFWLTESWQLPDIESDFLMWLLWTILQLRRLLYFILLFIFPNSGTLLHWKIRSIGKSLPQVCGCFLLGLILTALARDHIYAVQEIRLHLLVREMGNGYSLNIWLCCSLHRLVNREWRNVSESLCISCREVSRGYFSRNLCHQLHFSLDLFRTSYQNFCTVLLLLLLAHGNFYSWMATLTCQVLCQHQPSVDRVVIKYIPTDQNI